MEGKHRCGIARQLNAVASWPDGCAAPHASSNCLSGCSRDHHASDKRQPFRRPSGPGPDGNHPDRGRIPAERDRVDSQHPPRSCYTVSPTTRWEQRRHSFAPPPNAPRKPGAAAFRPSMAPLAGSPTARAEGTRVERIREGCERNAPKNLELDYRR